MLGELIGIALPGVASGSSLAITLSSMFLYGFGIGAIAMTASATIATSARQHSAKAFTEGNIVAGTAMVIGPALVGFIARSTLGWQAAFDGLFQLDAKSG